MIENDYSWITEKTRNILEERENEAYNKGIKLGILSVGMFVVGVVILAYLPELIKTF